MGLESIFSAGASAASLTASPDHNHPTGLHAEDIMGVDFSEQLLTPENSRSETSSNHEHASTEEKPTSWRRSARATRESLRSTEQLDAQQHTLSSGEEDVNTISGVFEEESSQPSCLHNDAAAVDSTMLPPRESGSALHERPTAPDTPISEMSQEQHQGNTNAPLPPRTLRRLVEKVLAGKEDKDRQQDGTSSADADSPKPLRRSARLGPRPTTNKFSSILGKRTRDTMKTKSEAARANNRRASLRPRKPVTSKENVASEPPLPKKRCGVESALFSKFTSEGKDQAAQEETLAAPKPAPQNRRKIWLSHGLYAGQEHTTQTRAYQRKSGSRRRRTTPAQRTFLPAPMFAGDRLLKTGRDFRLPFDIFSPLPPGQPKPDEWRRTNKNVFVGEAGRIWKANKHLELSSCTCTEATGCDENCQNRFMFYECDDSNCRLGSECGNRSFEELKQRTKAGGKYNIGVEVIKTKDRGYGVRSNRTFEPNQIIVEYTGEIITQAECERRMRTVYKNNDCYYLMYFDQNMIIDATRGSIARFVNHSCEPNCRMEKWTVSGKPRMALFAGSRGIMTGDELSYDYNFDPYSQKNVQECRCGSSTCRGILGPRPKDKEKRMLKQSKTEEKASRFKSSTKSAGSRTVVAKRKREAALDVSTSRVNKKRKILSMGSVKTKGKRAATKTKQRVTASKTDASERKVTNARGRGRATKTGRAATAIRNTRKTNSVIKTAAKATKTVKASTRTPGSKKTTASTTTKSLKPKAGRVKKETKRTKANVKLPKVAIRSRLKGTTVHGTKKPASSPSAQQSVSKLKRSAKAKPRVTAGNQTAVSPKRASKEQEKEGREPKQSATSKRVGDKDAVKGKKTTARAEDKGPGKRDRETAAEGDGPAGIAKRRRKTSKHAVPETPL
ncbi:hypothetical protein MAP00_008253 [Monascus purpureus]|nr:hypothetical protein MAP00_008253 [Monascus purpureus]